MSGILMSFAPRLGLSLLVHSVKHTLISGREAKDYLELGKMVQEFIKGFPRKVGHQPNKAKL